MENINLQLLRKINCLLTGLLAIIGFSCGENGEIPCEYGSPHANFQIKGKVTDMKGEPTARLLIPPRRQSRNPFSLDFNILWRQNKILIQYYSIF